MGDAVSMAEGGITRSKGTNLPIASVRNTVEESLFLTRVCRLTYMVENKRPCVHLSQQYRLIYMVENKRAMCSFVSAVAQ